MKRILWITNTIFPAPSKALGIPPTAYGGWMYGLAQKIATSPGIRLAVATTYPGKDLKTFDIDGVIYYLLPSKSTITYQKNLEPYWQKVCGVFNPNIVHIHGTEYTHGLACMRICPSLNYVVSIQGLVSICSRYYYGGISHWEILKNITFRDLARLDTLFQAKKSFEKRGEFEREYIHRSKHVIGRTNWDYAHIKTINAAIAYYYCNESLRDNFYMASKWNINTKTDYTIFLTQASYPLKGMHQVIKAVSILKTAFPFITVRIAGPSIVKSQVLLDKIKLSGYGAYIRTLIEKLKLSDHIVFLGTLTEYQMIAEYQNAHLFICPSSIENSPNSLGEAQIIGVPSIAAYVGGVPDMVVNEVSGLIYRFEEIEMLAENIRRIFNDNTLSLNLSKKGIQVAEQRHNQLINLNQTLAIYRKILN